VLLVYSFFGVDRNLKKETRFDGRKFAIKICSVMLILINNYECNAFNIFCYQSFPRQPVS